MQSYILRKHHFWATIRSGKNQRATRACFLESDILVLPARDLIEIGENRANISEGLLVKS
ncbi:hypothetical protein C2G38_1116437 [Gigaspora rosea]|uniref:Uncharacterized protein n=1 Tax=Gigaspora rosea TaxID=44941 RepID=A0A397W652_9GLOM|nr:hypothetical protein C2G38_1116437 [Gigaspora rosea]